MKKRFALLLVSLCWLTVCLGQDKQSLIQSIKNTAEKKHCVIGVTAIHIENQKEISYHGDQAFFMASTVKVPIAIALLKKVDNNQLTLNHCVSVRPNQAVPGSGILYHELNDHPIVHQYPIKQLMKLMLTISDNTASDVLLKEAGGPTKVTRFLRDNGYQHIHVNRSIHDLYLSASGFGQVEKIYLNKWLQRALAKLDPKKKIIAWKSFELEKRDTTTPHDMAFLLSKFYQRQILSEANTELLLDMMSQCKTGKNRIKKFLPNGAQVAHKTGTWTLGHSKLMQYPPAKKLSRYASDVGILNLPGHKGHIAIAIYVKSKGMADSERDATIATVSKHIYDFFSHS